MKTLKCPLCGETPEYILDEGDGHCEYAGCPKCGLYAAPSWGDWNCSPNEEYTWQRWRDLVSKFPPFMRVQVGDRIRHVYQFNPYRGTPRIVEEVNVQEGWIRATGNKPILRPNEITTWPWELEEKGEQQ